MARLLIVSRSMALAMRLADQHDVVEHSVKDLDTLLPRLDDADVLVLDLGDPVLAVNTVNVLREAEQIIPVLLVSGYQPEWEQVEAQQVDGVHVVPLPITRVALLHGITALLSEDSGLDVDASEDADVRDRAAETPPATPAPAPAPARAPAPAPARASTPAPAPAQTTRPVPGVRTTQQPIDSPAPSAAAKTAAAKAVAARAAATKAVAAKVAAAKAAADAAATDRANRAKAARDAASAGSTQTSPAGRANPQHPQHPPNAPAKSVDVANQGTSNPPDRGLPRTGAIPAVTQSDEVAGVSYSTSITRPFDEYPRTGQFQMPEPQTPTGSARWARHGQGRGAVPSIDDATEAKPADIKQFPGSVGGNAMARRLQRLGNRPRKLQRRPGLPEITDARPSTGMGLVTDPLGPRTDPYGFPASALDRRLDADAASLGTRGESGFAFRTAELVRMLHERASELYSVSDTAQVLAEDVIERASADAAAILVPDGPIWRVSGGVGLRPLERRLELQESHWLISEIGAAGRAVLIEDTDIIREQLSGAPLAPWRHLLAVPVPDVRGIVVLARSKEAGPFTDGDLSAVIAPVREAAGLLSQAVQARRLARMLDPLREANDDVPSHPTT